MPGPKPGDVYTCGAATPSRPRASASARRLPRPGGCVEVAPWLATVPAGAAAAPAPATRLNDRCAYGACSEHLRQCLGSCRSLCLRRQSAPRPSQGDRQLRARADPPRLGVVRPCGAGHRNPRRCPAHARFRTQAPSLRWRCKSCRSNVQSNRMQRAKRTAGVRFAENRPGAAGGGARGPEAGQAGAPAQPRPPQSSSGLFCTRPSPRLAPQFLCAPWPACTMQ